MISGKPEGEGSATKKNSLSMFQSKQMARWEKLSNIAKDLRDSYIQEGRKKSI